nr:hypothetical protein [uncultured Selenomonas sp.]
MKMKFVHIWRKIHFLAGDCMQQVHARRKECGIEKTPQQQKHRKQCLRCFCCA